MHLYFVVVVFALFLVANDEANLGFSFFSFGMFLVALVVFNTLFGFLTFGVIASGNGACDWIILIM